MWLGGGGGERQSACGHSYNSLHLALRIPDPMGLERGGEMKRSDTFLLLKFLGSFVKVINLLGPRINACGGIGFKRSQAHQVGLIGSQTMLL